MENLIPLATRKKKELIKDKLAFVDTVDKGDLRVLNDMLQADDKSRQTARMFIGASEVMPVRVLGYLASAVRVAQLTAVDQLQVISVSSLGAHINKIDKDRADEQFEHFAKLGMHIMARTRPELAAKLTFAKDTPNALPHVQALAPLMQEVIERDRDLKLRLAARGAKHGGNFVEYAAAHLAYQDTRALELSVVRGPETIDACQAIDVGCLQEKHFFAARRVGRQMLSGAELLPAVQVFSLHASAPYFVGHGDGQLLDEAIATRQIDFGSGVDRSVQRELAHLQLFLDGGEHHA